MNKFQVYRNQGLNYESGIILFLFQTGRITWKITDSLR